MLGSVLGVLRDVLWRAGFEVESAETATEAINLLATRRYAVVLADCFLPDLPPLDWLAALRSVAPRTALIVYSGTIGPEELRGHAADFGAVAVLEKAFSEGAGLVRTARLYHALPRDIWRIG